MFGLIDACTSCGTFQRIPFEDLYVLGIEENICEFCLKERLDNDDIYDIMNDDSFDNLDKELQNE